MTTQFFDTSEENPMAIQIIENSSVSLAGARELMAKARAACATRGFAAAIAVTDTGGHLVAFERADAAPFLTGSVAIDKAWTAASFGLSTDQWNRYVAAPEVAPLAHHPRLMAVGGGAPLTCNGRTIGGIGISGGSSDQDHEAAQEALRSLGLLA